LNEAVINPIEVPVSSEASEQSDDGGRMFVAMTSFRHQEVSF
jgi:hypothetical protein